MNNPLRRTIAGLRPAIQSMLGSGKDLLLIGAHDALSARLGFEAGFDAIWGSGFEIAASMGFPDANIVTMTEQLQRCREMAQAVPIPVIADCDAGYGEISNVVRTVHEFEAAGVSGLCLEDNAFPKRCSFYEGVTRKLADADEHVRRIRAAVRSRGSESFFVIARTEALIAGYSMEEALERGHAYADEGADAVLVHSKLGEPGEVLEFAERWRRPRVPLVAVPTTYDKTPARLLHEAGFRIVIFANQGLRSSIRSVQHNLRLLRKQGHASGLREFMVTIDEVARLAGIEKLQEEDAGGVVARAKSRAVQKFSIDSPAAFLDRATALLVGAGDFIIHPLEE